MAQPELVEDFFGVYLLCCENPKYKGRCYIGYTRDPKRRITQHNKGSWAGGAHRTSNRGPWKMVLIVHGFPNNISALRFEWAWQNPTKTKRLQHLNLRKIPRKETVYKFNLRVLSEMLRVGPWYRLPLLIRWLERDYEADFPVERTPPSHMPICHGPVKSRNLKKNIQPITPSSTECLLCSQYITNHLKMSCLNTDCELICHVTCLAELILSPGEYVPIEGNCLFCGVKLKWGDLIRKMKGCKMGDDKSSDDKNDVSMDDDVSDDDDVVFNDVNDVRSDAGSDDDDVVFNDVNDVRSDAGSDDDDVVFNDVNDVRSDAGSDDDDVVFNDVNDVRSDAGSDDDDVVFNDVNDVRSDAGSDDSGDDVVCVESNKVKTPTKVVDYPAWFND